MAGLGGGAMMEVSDQQAEQEYLKILQEAGISSGPKKTGNAEADIYAELGLGG